MAKMEDSSKLLSSHHPSDILSLLSPVEGTQIIWGLNLLDSEEKKKTFYKSSVEPTFENQTIQNHCSHFVLSVIQISIQSELCQPSNRWCKTCDLTPFTIPYINGVF